MQPDSRYQSWLCADVHKVFREREGEKERERERAVARRGPERREGEGEEQMETLALIFAALEVTSPTGRAGVISWCCGAHKNELWERPFVSQD